MTAYKPLPLSGWAYLARMYKEARADQRPFNDVRHDLRCKGIRRSISQMVRDLERLFTETGSFGYLRCVSGRWRPAGSIIVSDGPPRNRAAGLARNILDANSGLAHNNSTMNRANKGSE